jgi:DNA-binding IclR family transcriptional regulator
MTDEQKVLNFIRKKKPARNVDISEGTGLNPPRVHYILKEMIRAKKIKFTPACYEIVE